MIEIEAEILRGSCTPVFFVGEIIECEIKFKCVSAKNKIKTKKKPQDFLPEQFQDSNLLENKFNKIHISESMFSILSAHSSDLSTPNSSQPQTPLVENKHFFKPTSSQSDEPENDCELTIAWACAQIDSSCFIDESKVILPIDPLRFNTNNESNKLNEGSTSFQPNKDRAGISLFSSKPKILFCNLSLRPNEVKSCIQFST